MRRYVTQSSCLRIRIRTGPSLRLWSRVKSGRKLFRKEHQMKPGPNTEGDRSNEPYFGTHVPRG